MKVGNGWGNGCSGWARRHSLHVSGSAALKVAAAFALASIIRARMTEKIQLPEVYEKDIARAVAILKGAGCTQVFLFGSLASEKVREGSDIDLAIRGCPKGSFFHLLGKLLFELDHSVDLVSLDRPDPFARYLETKGGLLQIG